ncbi:MAG: glutamine--tRNA ligase/YqeY domain fusion protein [Bacteroidales bacterium]|jgi:glutaminyl-tRNA synthetase|nr:glutamine--tRNA ligase/YqeY domain fusion protein [Bacteroidales bacterium]NLH24582.1 glutamine--tRNA ligase/YqeY domain fusion protein [Bacteroidales bacterium]HPJ82829.1 glutamine--tRNA ligase/YqeY domain fusion protein [Bacteroidales bacterium]
MNAENTQTSLEHSLNFIEEIIQADLTQGKHQSIITRFPPEPNGYLHIGHAKSICLNFGLARKFGGKTNLRFDDTNPTKEDTEYVDSIKEDINWLGFQWANEFYASDYFEQLYQWAHVLIRKGLAYVDDQTQDEIRLNRGTVTTPGKDSPWRDRSIEENADLFTRMRNGEFPDGRRVLRAKIDMSHPNMLMRDPLMYRIIHAEHHRTGNTWCIYPMYDYAHGQCDSIEQITHSVCTLEFDVHRPLYDWFIEQLDIFPSHQYEFARLNITHTVMSKRKLLELVQTGLVNGWDDPRMPTICGLRRRGYTPSAIRLFAEKVGVAKRDNVIDIALMEWCIREELNKTAPRHMAVLDPLKVIITNYPEGREEFMKAPLNPEDPSAGERLIPFSREIYIERDDFMENPPKKYFRLMPGGEVRLKYGYIIKCENIVRDNNGKLVELHCTLDPDTKPGTGTWRSVKGTIHWLSARHAIAGEVRLFDRLFTEPYMGSIPEDKDYRGYLNPDSLKIVQAYIDNQAALLANEAVSGKDDTRIRFQFERLGYFVPDYDSTPERPVFNRICILKDSFARTLNQP